MTSLEDALPAYDFNTRHSLWIAAPPASVWSAMTALTLRELRIARPLIWIRHPGGKAGDAAQNLFQDGPVRIFELDPPRYAVGGAVARPWQRSPDRAPVASLQQFTSFDEPGWVAFLTDFTLESRAGGVQLTTVTRVRCTDDQARRRFTRYWACIRVPSGLIRRDILAAISRSARRVAGPGRVQP